MINRLKKISEDLTKFLEEENDLRDIWANELQREPVIDTPDGPIYLQPSKDGKSIEFGTMTNNGMIVDGSVEYDFDYSLDSNLDAVYDEIRDYYELYLVPEEDRDQVVTDEKEDRLNSLLDETMERYLLVFPEGLGLYQGNTEEDFYKNAEIYAHRLTDEQVINIAKTHFKNITKDIKVKWID